MAKVTTEAEADNSYRSNSSHIFTIHETTNIRKKITKISLVCFSAMKKFCTDITNAYRNVYCNKKRHWRIKKTISWKKLVDSGFVKTCDEFVNSLYLEPVSILNESQGRNEKSQMEFTMLDYAAIRDIFETGPELFKLLVSSLCPSIYGHELVKAGLLLALFGGTSKYTNDSAFVPVRGDPHVLVVGDPGLGKVVISY